MPASQYELFKKDAKRVPYMLHGEYRIMGVQLLLVVTAKRNMATREAFLDYMNTTRIVGYPQNDPPEPQNPVILQLDMSQYWVLMDGDLVTLRYQIDPTSHESPYDDAFFLKNVAGVWYGHTAEIRPLT